jgi:monoterpene epsilon-lactone hydrolase
MQSLRSRIIRTLVYNVTSRSPDNIQHLRQLANRGGERRIAPPGVRVQPVDAGGARAEWLVPAGSPAAPVILYFHGGAWTLGWYNGHRWGVGCLAKACRARALAVDYRLAPEHPFPAALEDCLAAYRFLLAQCIPPGKIVLAGDSAGGNLVLVTLLALREAGDPLHAAVVCFSPVTDLCHMAEETAQPKADPSIPMGFAEASVRAYLAGEDPCHPLISPIEADLHGLPPLLIQAGADEVLCESAERFAARARAAGVRATFQSWPGMWHVWQMLTPFLPEADWAIEVVADFVQKETGGGIHECR